MGDQTDSAVTESGTGGDALGLLIATPPSRIASIVLAASAGAAIGCYVGFPAAISLRARFAPRPVRLGLVPLPGLVSVLIAAHDEAADIGAKLDDLVAQELIGTRFEVIVASDGSTDDTVSIASNHPSQPIVLDLPRAGKASALNAGIDRCSGEIIVFTDANSRLEVGTLSRLLAPFTDPEVGGVAGDQRYGDGGGGAGEGERSYWSYERTLKQMESACGNVVSSTGALHALRRRHVEPVPGDVTDDFFLSVGAISGGQRLVFEPSATAWEQPSQSAGAEYHRKVRIITRGLTGVARRRELLDPRRSGGYAVVLFVHKVARRMMFVPLAAAVAASWVQRDCSIRHRLMWWGQAGLYGAGALGWAGSNRRWGRLPFVALPAVFVRTNVAAAHAVLNFVLRRRYVSWDHQRSDKRRTTDPADAASS